MRYRFYPIADAAQDRIWSETARRWSEEQADQYIEGLHAHLEKLAESRSLWRRLPVEFYSVLVPSRTIYLSR